MMNPVHGRRSIRLREFDYRAANAYFVTLCVARREHLLGAVTHGEMRLSDAGVIVTECWQELPAHFQNVTLDLFVAMPDHVHGLVVINTDPVSLEMRVDQPHCASRSLGAIVGSFKSAGTKRINRLNDTPGAVLWQRNYYETVIRDEHHLASVRKYIRENPARWSERRNV